MTIDFDAFAPPTPEERARNAEEAHAKAMARGANCLGCPLYGCQRGPVMPEVRPNSRLAVVGEAPGPREVEQGAPFKGPSGRVLNQCLSHGGLERTDATITNVLLCQPPDDFETYMERLRRDAEREGRAAVLPTECCRPRLERDLNDTDATVELAVGKQALAALAKRHIVAYGRDHKVDEGQVRIASMKKQHGAPVIIRDAPRKIVMGTYHPAFAFRGSKEWMPVIKRELTRAARLAKRGGEVDWKRPEYNIDPTIEEVEAFADTVIENNYAVTVDIETGPSQPGLDDGANTQRCVVRCVGMGYTAEDGSEHVIVVPFRNMDGTPEWGGSRNILTRALIAVRRIMDTCRIIGQNVVSFDFSVMLRVGLMTDRHKSAFDTMLAHHNTEANDLPHDLGFITSELFEAPHHKDDADHKVVNNVGYPRLKFYNGDDILTTMRAAPLLAERIERLCTQAQFETDTQLAPVCRDMGDLGLVIHEPTRQQLATELLAKCDHYRSEFQRHAHRPGLNPNSPDQLRQWLFGDLGIIPQLNTDQYEWEEGQDPSTSAGALLKLQEKGVDDNVDHAIDALLEYKAWAKLYGTYVADRKGRIRDVDWTQWGCWQDDARRILNTTYKIHIIPSGRLSTKPAIQNWPALGKANMRTMVVSPPGHCIVGADYDQLELRIYAVVAQDKLLLQAFAEGKDPHSLNAASLLARHESEIWDVYEKIVNSDPKEKKYWRTVAKRFCYLETYGGEEDKLFQVMSASRNKATGKKDFPELSRDPAKGMKQVQQWHERWHRLHPETKAWQRNCQQACHEFGFVGVYTLDGRKRFFPGGVSKKNAPPNHTIQGFAASIANRALLKLAEAIPHRGWSPVSGLCLQVHDYIGAYVPRERAIEAAHLIKECLEYEYNGMPFTCTPEISERWSDQG